MLSVLPSDVISNDSARYSNRIHIVRITNFLHAQNNLSAQ